MGKDKQSEKRQSIRQWSNKYLLTSPVVGKVTDITFRGIGVETREPLPILKRRVFTIGSAMTRLKYQGEVRWCRLVDSVPLRDGERSAVYRSGIAFVDDQAPDQA